MRHHRLLLMEGKYFTATIHRTRVIVRFLIIISLKASRTTSVLLFLVPACAVAA